MFETALGRIGILIGYDAEFPQIARAMVEAGAEVLLVPSCTETLRGYWQVRIGGDGAGAREPVRRGARRRPSATRTGCRRRTATTGRRRSMGRRRPASRRTGSIALGKPDTAGWVHGEVSLEAVRQARAEGTARIFGDDVGGIGAVETVSLGRSDL